MPSDVVTTEIEKALPRTVDQIREAVRHPSVSPEHLGGREYAGFLRDLYADVGCAESHVVETGDDWPGVWGFFDAGAEHTIASYCYFDTYGVREEAWTQPPFGGTLGSSDGFPSVVFGRGAGVKGSHIAWVNALAALAADGSLPVNVLLLAEGAEMMGSPNFQAICADASRHLGSVEALLSPRIAEIPGRKDVSVVLGYKNMVTFDLECRAADWGRGPSGGRVFGNSKSVVDSPTHRLIQAVASMLSPDGNGVAIEGLADSFAERRELSDEEGRLVASLGDRFAGREWNEVLPTTAGVRVWAGDVSGDHVLYNYLYGASISVSEIRSAGVAEVPQLTMLLPESARASVELRMVTDRGASDILDAVRQHLQRSGFPEIEVIPAGMWDAWQISVDDAVAKAAISTLERYGKEPVVWPIQPFGGPWAGLARQLDVPSLTGSAIGYGANGGAGNDEYLVIESDGRVGGLKEVESFMCDLLLAYESAMRPGKEAS